MSDVNVSVSQLSTSGRFCTKRWSSVSQKYQREPGPYVSSMGLARYGTGLAGSDM